MEIYRYILNMQYVWKSFFFSHNAVLFYSAVCVCVCVSVNHFGKVWQLLTHSSIAAHITSLLTGEIITQRSTKPIFCVSVCLSVWAAECRKDRERKEGGSQGPEYPLKSHENENCSKHSKNPPHASVTGLFFRAGSDSDLDCQPFLLFFFFFTLNWIEFQTSEAVSWWSLTLREPCSVTSLTQSLKSLNEKEKKGEEEQFMISHFSERRRREK